MDLEKRIPFLKKGWREEQRERSKAVLDELHKRKIDLSDEIYVVDVNGYVGESTRSEIDYAREKNKIVNFLSTDKELLSAIKREKQ